MNYDSRSTWDSGLDAGSIPARSIQNAKGAVTLAIDCRRSSSFYVLFILSITFPVPPSVIPLK